MAYLEDLEDLKYLETSIKLATSHLEMKNICSSIYYTINSYNIHPQDRINIIEDHLDKMKKQNIDNVILDYYLEELLRKTSKEEEDIKAIIKKKLIFL